MNSLEHMQAEYEALLAELTELAECWLEAKVAGMSTLQLDAAINQATRESRKIEKKLKKVNK
jgi:hypothetical protein